MEDGNGKSHRPAETLSNEQIVTERTLPRRSFLAQAGALLVGAAAIATATRAVAFTGAQQSDPDKAKTKASDPDQKKAPTTHRVVKGKSAKATDPDQKRAKAADPDQKRKKSSTKVHKANAGEKAEDPDKAKQPH